MLLAYIQVSLVVSLGIACAVAAIAGDISKQNVTVRFPHCEPEISWTQACYFTSDSMYRDGELVWLRSPQLVCDENLLYNTRCQLIAKRFTIIVETESDQEKRDRIVQVANSHVKSQSKYWKGECEKFLSGKGGRKAYEDPEENTAFCTILLREFEALTRDIEIIDDELDQGYVIDREEGDVKDLLGATTISTPAWIIIDVLEHEDTYENRFERERMLTDSIVHERLHALDIDENDGERTRIHDQIIVRAAIFAEIFGPSVVDWKNLQRIIQVVEGWEDDE